jgi:predicted transposase/invertase (TIGR01784 family)
MERLNPLNDLLFQKVMGEKGDEPQLIAFLNAVLGRTGPDRIVSVEILGNKTLTPRILGDKTIILDLRAITDRGERINIEVQLKDLHNMGQRTLFHWSREYEGSLQSGEDYGSLPKVITINIVNFDYIELPEYHTSFHLREDRHPEYILTEVLEIHFISMTKFRKQAEKDLAHNALDRWMTFFDRESGQALVEEIVKMDSAIERAAVKLNFVTGDREFLHQYHLREMALSDKTTEINTAFERGLEQGIEQGLERGIEQVAKNLLQKAHSLEYVQEVTGLSIEQIKRLR